MARTVEQIDADITKVREAMNKIYEQGEEYRTGSGGSFVNNRRASLPDLQNQLHNLQAERREVVNGDYAGSHGIG